MANLWARITNLVTPGQGKLTGEEFDEGTAEQSGLHIIAYAKTAAGAIVPILVDSDGKLVLAADVDIEFTGENLAQETGGNLATLAGIDFATQTTLALIKAKTDNIPTDPSKESGKLTDIAADIRKNGVSTTIDDATFSATVTGSDIDFSKYNHALLSVKTGAVTDTPTLSVALQIKDSNGNYVTHTTLATISTATTVLEEFYFLAAQTVRVVATYGGSGSFATTTVELAMK